MSTHRPLPSILCIFIWFTFVAVATPSTHPFCSNSTVTIHRLFTYRSCLYFSLISLEKEWRTAEVNVSSRGHSAIWHEYCLEKRTISANLLSTRALFGGHIEGLDTAVELPAEALSAWPNLTATLPSRAVAIVLTFVDGFFHQALVQVQRSNNSDLVVVRPSEDLIDQVGLFFRGSHNDSSSIDLLGGQAAVHSLTYNVHLKHLYTVFGPIHLAIFNLKTSIWTMAMPRLPNRGPIPTIRQTLEEPERQKRSNTRLRATTMIIYASGQLFLGFPLHLLSVKVTEDLKNIEMDPKKRISWRIFFNCFNNSPLLPVDSKVTSVVTNVSMLTEKSTTQTIPGKINEEKEESPRIKADEVSTIKAGAWLGSSWLQWVLYTFISGLVVLCLLIGVVGFVTSRSSRSRASPSFEPDKSTAQEIPTTDDAETGAESKESEVSNETTPTPSETEITTVEEEKSKKKKPRTRPRPRRKSKKSKKRRSDKSSSSRSSLSRLSRSLLSFFWRDKKAKKKKRSGSGRGGNKGSPTAEETLGQTMTGDYSSKLKFFNRNSINISRSMSTLRSSTTTSSTRSFSSASQSLKTIRIGRVGDEDDEDSLGPTSPSRPITSMPTSERAARRPYALGYLAREVVKPGGFRLMTRDPVLDAIPVAVAEEAAKSQEEDNSEESSSGESESG